MPSERRPFQTAFLSNRKTVGKLAERVQSRYDGLHKFKHICSAAMALIKEPLDKAKQRNEELEAAEEAAAQEALGREQEVDRVSEWEERYKLSRSEFEQFWKGLPQTVQNKLQASQKTWKSGMDKICANNAKAEGETPNGIKFSELWHAKRRKPKHAWKSCTTVKKPLSTKWPGKRTRKNCQSGSEQRGSGTARRYCRNRHARVPQLTKRFECQMRRRRRIRRGTI
ncbi:TPA: hypothetical protein ACJMC9_001224 [Neisseria meningitidis]